VFYTHPDGQVRSLTQIWGDQQPRAVAIFAGAMQLAGQHSVRRALRFMTAQGRFAN